MTAPWLDPARMRARGDKPMTTTEVLAEVDHLAMFPRVTADDIATALGKTVGGLYSLTRRHGRLDLADIFKPPSTALTA